MLVLGGKKGLLDTEKGNVEQEPFVFADNTRYSLS